MVCGNNSVPRDFLPCLSFFHYRYSCREFNIINTERLNTMQPSRFLRILFFVALLTACSFALEVAVNEPECATPGECANSEAEESVVETLDDVPVVDKQSAVPEDPKCPSRPHIIRCAAANLDTNKNNKLDRVELETAINALPWYSKGILKILGSADKIMQKCDYDNDGAIGIDDDMEKTKETCLATCFKRRAFKGAFFPDCEL